MGTTKTNTGSRSKSPKNPRGAGRTPSLTKEIQELFLANLRLGIDWESCARLAGVAPNTVKNWKARAEQAREKIPSKRDAFDNKCLEFLAQYEASEDEWVRRCETVLALSMEPGSSKIKWDEASDADKDRSLTTSKFKLTHQRPDKYSTKSATELTGKDGGPVDISLANGEDVFKVLLEAKAVEEASEE